MIIKVPATSANLGAGFDALGIALTIGLELRDSGPPAHEDHPATQAYRSSGGKGNISIKTHIPPARGLGFSGASRVAGCLAAYLQQGLDEASAREQALNDAIALEGHSDNAAPSMLGGLVICAGSTIAKVPVQLKAAVLLWVPKSKTSTAKSRSALPRDVPLEDASFNLGRAALFVAALSTDQPDLLQAATQDRLHQQVRLSQSPASAEALEAFLGAGAWGAWLSGSGPSIAALADHGRRDEIIAALPKDAEVLSLEIDAQGTTVDVTQ